MSSHTFRKRLFLETRDWYEMEANNHNSKTVEIGLFGDYTWGNEPLELPADFPEPQPNRIPLEGCTPTLWSEVSSEFLAEEEPANSKWRNPDPKVQHWFRWITGHQITILLWRASVVCLQEIVKPSQLVSKEVAAQHAIHLLRGYTCMLIYAGSCTRELYLSTFRDFMALHHEAFSGKWAFEYTQIPRLFGEALKGLKEDGRNDLFDGMVQAHKQNHLMHEAVAKKLVPEGPSLLQQAHTERNQALEVSWQHRFFFDSFFLVKRTKEDHMNLLHALLRRVRAALSDLRQNGLYPEIPVGTGTVKNSGLKNKELRFYEENLVELLREAVESAALVL